MSDTDAPKEQMKINDILKSDSFNEHGWPNIRKTFENVQIDGLNLSPDRISNLVTTSAVNTAGLLLGDINAYQDGVASIVCEPLPTDPGPVDPGGDVSVTTPPRVEPPAVSSFFTVQENDLKRRLGDPRNYSGSNFTWFNWPEGIDARLYTPDGAHLKDRDGDGLDDHRINKAIKDNLEWVLKELLRVLGLERFIAEGWHVFGGGVNVRTKKGGSGWSTHAWGLAVDFHIALNAFYSYSTTFSKEAVEIWHEGGFYWGPYAWGTPEYQASHRKGNSRKLYIDPMHFQAVKPNVYNGTYYAEHGFPNG